MTMTPEQATALEVARGLAGAGVPIFVAYPDSTSTTGFRLPAEWQTTTSDPRRVDAWRPGMAVCAVMGNGLDLVDLDPRNGATEASLNGITPIAYGVAATPSAGWHLFVKSMGVRSHDDVLPGVDIKAGVDGQGHGFAFLAPTVRVSKLTGQPVAYRWERPPDLAALAAAADDASGEKLAALVRAAHGSTSTTWATTAGDDQFADPVVIPPSPWADVAGALLKSRHKGVVKLAGSLRGRGGWRVEDALAYMRAVVWPLIDPTKEGRPYLEHNLERDIRDVFARYEDGHDEQRPAAATTVDADVDLYQRQVAAKLRELRIHDEARHRLAVEQRGDTGPPGLLTLKERLALPRTPVAWRVQDWQPAGSRVVLAAQFKAGKTTLRDNLVRCLADGDDWLNQYAVTPVDGTVAVLDLEMSGNQLDDWLRDQGITNDDRVLVEPLRGRATSFDLLDDRVLTQWAKWLRARSVSYLALDCLRPILDALGLDENRDAGRFLVAFERLLTEADVSEALVVHHMGHSGERSRGDSRIRDWPDVEWRLVRLDDDPASPRFLSGYGRDVDQRESQLVYIPDVRRLNLAGGSRADERSSRALKGILAELDKADEPLTGRGIEEALSESEHKRQAIRDGIKRGVRLKVIDKRPGAGRGYLYTRLKVADMSGSNAPAHQPKP